MTLEQQKRMKAQLKALMEVVRPFVPGNTVDEGQPLLFRPLQPEDYWRLQSVYDGIIANKDLSDE